VSKEKTQRKTLNLSYKFMLNLSPIFQYFVKISIYYSLVLSCTLLCFNQDKRNKTLLHGRLRKRRRLIEELRKKDFEKFDWLLTQLKINYCPHDEPTLGVGRKELRRRAAQDKLNTIIDKKMDEFRKHLAIEREEFERQKEKELKEIQHELKELGIDNMDSVENTLEALGFGEPYVKKGPVLSRRMQILARKFKLYEYKKLGRTSNKQ
jgi:hypothetical protein